MRFRQHPFFNRIISSHIESAADVSAYSPEETAIFAEKPLFFYFECKIFISDPVLVFEDATASDADVYAVSRNFSMA